MSYNAPSPRESFWSRTPKRNMVNKWIGGVCSGLGDYFGIDATILRLAMVLSLFLPGPQLIFYVAAWIIMPARKSWETD
ncbi:DNA-binding transcriptional activator PspC [Corynebacterium urogenitale]|uniref:DNA-binding transcriptional activator PspC n=1 Tax=Corynebacterium urogenitale TaxID=2487892 RepID=A0A5J6ZCQ4_9CORY|nr:DNA-binding transcriptional activator PspC [Corynebacterium urogenitale]